MKKRDIKLVYISNTRLPTEKAHGLATMKLCEAFSDIGYDVDVVAPLLWRRDSRDIFKYYGIEDKFNIHKTPTIDLMPFGISEKVAFLIQILSFSTTAFFYVLFKYGRSENIVYYSHDYMPLYFMTFLSKNVFYDVHHFPGKNFMYKRLMKKSAGFFVQTRWKINELKEKWGIDEKSVVYWPNGTDVEMFKTNISKSDARKKLDLSSDMNIVLYTGQLFDWKGVDTLIKSLDFLPDNTYIYILGGAKSDISRIKGSVPQALDRRIKFVKFQPHGLIPLWQKAADILVLPNTGKQRVSLYYTSPMKLFEYMASGTPIVASNILSITEILNEDNAFLAEADNPKSFGDVINSVLILHSDDRARVTQRAQRDVKNYTWVNRATKIKNLIDKKI